MNLLLKALAFSRLVKLVWLEDHNRELYLSIKRKHPFCGYWAYVLSFHIGTVILNEDGTCSGPSIYIKRWMDY